MKGALINLRYPVNGEVYHAFYQPLEFVLPQRNAESCFTKAIVEKGTGRIASLHIIGPNAAEMMQGFAVALKRGITIDDLQHSVGIHPSSAEEVVKLRITRSSGEDPHVTGC